jgi:DNA-binding transcriptional MerR regulator
MNHFTITDIENLTGIKAHTLRIWEQRYQLNLCQRKDGGHRFYDGEDLKKILRIAVLYKKGHRISTLVELSDDQLLSYNLQDFHAGVQTETIRQLFDAVMAFDQDKFNQIFHTLVLHMGLEKCLLEVIFPLLNQIGKRWLIDRVVPAQEHFCSELIIKKILLATDGLEPMYHPNPKSILVFTPFGETHEIPVLFMHYLLKKHGHRSVYLGKNVPLDVVELFCRERMPDCLYFHLITQLGELTQHSYIGDLQKLAPEAKLVCSGPGMATFPINAETNFKWLKDANEMIQFTKN